MYHVKANDLRFTLPSDWSEINLAQALKILTEDLSTGELLSLLSGLDESLFRNTRIDLKAVPVFKMIENVPDFESIPVPNEITVEGKEITLPSNVDFWSSGQRWDLTEELQQMEYEEEQVNFITASTKLLSIALAPVITGTKYQDISQVEPIVPLLKQLPCTIAFPLAAFFLLDWQNPTYSGTIKWQEIPPVVTKKQPKHLRRAWQRLIRFIFRKP